MLAHWRFLAGFGVGSNLKYSFSRKITAFLFFPVPFLFEPKAQKGIDKGKKSTRFWRRCIVGWNYTWAQKSTWNGSWVCVRACVRACAQFTILWTVPEMQEWRAIPLDYWRYCKRLVLMIIDYDMTFTFMTTFVCGQRISFGNKIIK